MIDLEREAHNGEVQSYRTPERPSIADELSAIRTELTAIHLILSQLLDMASRIPFIKRLGR